MSVPSDACPDDERSITRRRGINTRLRTENWHDMARPAFESDQHVGNIKRWIKRAKDANPTLTDDQARRQGERDKAEFYAALSAAAKSARKARAAIAAIEGGDPGDG